MPTGGLRGRTKLHTKCVLYGRKISQVQKTSLKLKEFWSARKTLSTCTLAPHTEELCFCSLTLIWQLVRIAWLVITYVCVFYYTLYAMKLWGRLDVWNPRWFHDSYIETQWRKKACQLSSEAGSVHIISHSFLKLSLSLSFCLNSYVHETYELSTLPFHDSSSTSVRNTESGNIFSGVYTDTKNQHLRSTLRLSLSCLLLVLSCLSLSLKTHYTLREHTAERGWRQKSEFSIIQSHWSCQGTCGWL